MTFTAAPLTSGLDTPLLSRRPAFGGIAVGCAGVMMLGLQPLLLGALIEEHRLSIAQLGQAATMEQLLLGLVSAVLGGLAPRRHLRVAAGLGCLLLIAGNVASLYASDFYVVLSRAVCGAGGGVLVWIAGIIIAFSYNPARLSGIYVGAQAVSQFLLAAILPGTAMRSWGANGGFAALGIVTLLALVATVGLPAQVGGVKSARTAGPVNAAALFGLAAGFLFMAAVVGLYVFIEPLAAVAGVSSSLAEYATAANLAAQIGGAALCVIFSRQIVPHVEAALMASIGLFVLALALVSVHLGGAMFMAGVALHGSVWTIGLSLFTPFLILVDPTRRGAVLLSGMLLLGGSAGPLLTGWFATDTRLTPVLWTTAVLTVGWMIAMLAARMLRQRSGVATAGGQESPGGAA
jgi:hypothetical protein